jgi:protein-disulfide isomerase
LALLILALLGAACGRATTVSPTAAPTPTRPPAPVTAGPAAPTKPAATTSAPASQLPKVENLPVGVDADGNFYRGDPKAPVKLVEFSDFQ